ncbi:thiamine pyrophosphate-binding protein [Streptomyces sp. TG1A-8]|uniref:alpha-keto acid decarboxylase family protein n=1 Tax=Streptomyces sp. TG1A-8 TaxID=3051385 RepID=UPI00265C6965|nr:thiamine pyrophosphate-binding protein [Streptomyces sp. TG1A-8]MDO0927298.1 thiamine pyrophosphate-binding protein [Streptomyces sp. TG1A-8]
MSMTEPPPTITVGEYLLHRLVSLGVHHLFGVPGDYNLAFLDTVLASPHISWVGTANELGAAYAADGYARTRSFGALLTTFGVGELSAVNGVAGSYAERVPLVHITVGPSQAAERAGAIVHHTAADGDYDRFARAHASVVCASAVLRPDNAAREIDRVLSTALHESRPVYLRLPSDVALAQVQAPTGTLRRPPEVNEKNLAAFRTAAEERISSARSAAVLADFLVDRFQARSALAGLLDAGSLPWAVLSSGKTVLPADTPGFTGVYSGELAAPAARAAIEGADLLIRAGVVLADTTTGGFTHRFEAEAGIDLAPHSASVDGKPFDGVPLAAGLGVLAELVERRFAGPKRAPLPAAAPPDPVDPAGPLTQDHLWTAVASWTTPDTTVIAEQGTSFFGMCTETLASGARFIAQPLWGSIGYTLPALLGAQLADRTRRGLLLIGDGSAQMTIQELGTLARQHLNPVIVLVNNDGYTVERAIHGPRAAYNDIAEWNWQAVPAALGAADALVLSAITPAQLDTALHTAAHTTDRMVFIEVRTDMDDVPELLHRLAGNVQARNGGEA